VASLTKDLKVLEDYFLRARQLVSLLRADSGKKKWFKDAVKRLNWDELEAQHAHKVGQIRNELEGKSHNVEVSLSSEESGDQIGFQLDLQ